MLTNKKPKFSPSNITEQEQNFIRMHNVAMGYEPRTNSSTSIDTDIIAIANDAFRYRVPCTRHFRIWFEYRKKQSLTASRIQLQLVSVTSVLPTGNV